MKCPRCNSTNTQVQAIKQPRKVKLIAFLCVFAGSFVGLCAAGLLGSFAGGIMGAIISIVIALNLPPKYKSVGVCQNCGYSAEIN